MKILLVNKYYYLKGGDCTYFLELEKFLRLKDHNVAVFAMQHPSNYDTPFKKYFPSEVDFTKKGIINIGKSLTRPLFSLEVKNKFEQLLDDFQPDVIHLNNIHSQLSPIIARSANKKGIPVVWTQHDYKILCPAYICTRNFEPCELCFTEKFNVIKHRCVKGSLAASTLAYLESQIWNREVLESYVYKFLCPSEFIQKKMIQGGFDAAKITKLPNFINSDYMPEAVLKRKNYYCYVGRLVKEKGLETLLQVSIAHPDIDLIIVGTGPQEAFLKSKYKADHIKFVGYKKWPEIEEIIKSAKFMVVPSEWYENNPLSIIEALSLGTPVVGSDAGGIPEMISDGINGFVFKSKDPLDLERAMNKILYNEMEFDYRKIQLEALSTYSAESHYEQIIEIYEEGISSSASTI